MNIVVTPLRAVQVTTPLYDEILKKKDVDKDFGDQILFLISVPASMRFTLEGDVPKAKTLAEFIEKHLPTKPPGFRRNIIT